MNRSTEATGREEAALEKLCSAAGLEQIRAVADHLPQLCWSCLPSGYCDYLSRQWVVFTGVAEREHHGHGWLEAVHPQDRQRTGAAWDAFVSAGVPYDVEYRLRRHDGAYLWFKTRGVLIADSVGKPVRVVGTTTDIDTLKRLEEKYRESQERLEAALTASGTGTFRWNIETNALMWDEQLDRLFGLTPGQTVRSLEKFIERVHPDDRLGVIERCRRCQTEGADFAMEFRVVWPDGTTHWLDDRGSTFRNADGKPAYMTGACVDITQRKLADEHIREIDERAAFVRKASGVGFWYCDLPFDVLQWDDLVKEHFHLPPEAQVTIEMFYERIHESDRAATRQAIEQSIAQHQGYDVHYRTVHPVTGAEKWIRAIGRTFYAADGTPKRFDGVTLDVTQQRRAQEQLTESEERFRVFMDYSPAAAWITDHDGRVRYVSAAYSQLFQLPSRPIVGASPTDLFTPEFAAEYVRNIRQVVESGQPLETIERAPKHDGTIGQFLVYKFPLPGSDCVGGVALDISERLQAEEQLRDADRRKDEFLAILAHELRNPLAPLRNGLQVMRLGGITEEVNQQAREMMERQLTHMVRLIDDLMDVSRISRNKLELRREQVLLSDVVTAAVETSRPAIDAAAHAFTMTLPSQPVYLNADLTRLAQVLANLLTNAAKYTPHSGSIHLEATVAGHQVAISVRDNGIGIPIDALHTIFDMFSQVDRSMERSKGGLGIGLALVKGLVEMHEGQVTAASAGAGKGCVFTVTLPLEQDLETGDNVGAGTVSAVKRGPSCRILIADDNTDAAESMAAMLRILGHVTRTTHDGEEAIFAAQEFLPDIILMDVGMPKLNGYDATRRIRELACGKSARIIAVTGWGQEEDRSQSRSAGCDGHLVKPVLLDDLAPFLLPRA